MNDVDNACEAAEDALRHYDSTQCLNTESGGAQCELRAGHSGGCYIELGIDSDPAWAEYMYRQPSRHELAGHLRNLLEALDRPRVDTSHLPR